MGHIISKSHTNQKHLLSESASMPFQLSASVRGSGASNEITKFHNGNIDDKCEEWMITTSFCLLYKCC